jgi:UPF0755 protein
MFLVTGIFGQNKGKLMKKFIVALIITLLITSSASYYYLANTDLSKSYNSINFIVNKGDGLYVIAKRLKSINAIRSTQFFKIVAKLAKLDSDFKYGTYRLRFPASQKKILEQLKNPQNLILAKLTIPEGTNMYEIEDILVKKGLCKPGNLIKITTNPSFIKEMSKKYFWLRKLKEQNLEGFLFPDTYKFQEDISLKQLVKMMLKNFDKNVVPIYNKYKSTLPKIRRRTLSFHNLIILASIIEKEAVIQDERPIISGVFLNRLEKRMILGADPTVKYAIRKFKKPIVTYRDLAIDSPYNTYKYGWLTPTPITNPGIKSIEAAFHPAKTDYYFFIADYTGRHKFSKTEREHNNWRQKLGYNKFLN